MCLLFNLYNENYSLHLGTDVTLLTVFCFSMGFLIFALTQFFCILWGHIIFCALISMGAFDQISWPDLGGSVDRICAQSYLSSLCSFSGALSVTLEHCGKGWNEKGRAVRNLSFTLSDILGWGAVGWPFSVWPSKWFCWVCRWWIELCWDYMSQGRVVPKGISLFLWIKGRWGNERSDM